MRAMLLFGARLRSSRRRTLDRRPDVACTARGFPLTIGATTGSGHCSGERHVARRNRGPKQCEPGALYSGRARVRDLTGSRPRISHRTGHAEPRRERPLNRARGQVHARHPGSFTSRFRTYADRPADRGRHKTPPHSTRGTRAQVVTLPAGCCGPHSGAPHISTERSNADHGVERGG